MLQLPALRLITVVLTIFLFSAFSNSVFAVDPPNAQPCENAVETDQLTDIYIPSSDSSSAKEPYFNRRIAFDTREDIVGSFGNQLNALQEGEIVTVTGSETFTMDFSKLQSLFAAPNSNYLEGSFQEESHRMDDILNLSEEDLDAFHGAGQRAAPQVMINQLRVDYVDYVYNHPTLQEAENLYADISGNDPKTVYDLVNEYGNPTPPDSGTNEQWDQTWGKYWAKIPTSYEEFYKGRLEFRMISSDSVGLQVSQGKRCPVSQRTIEFVLPEFKRTVSVTNQINQIIVPCVAQSWQHTSSTNTEGCGTTQTAENPLAQAIANCWKILTETPKTLTDSIKKAVKITMTNLNPLKPAFAQDFEGDPAVVEANKSCIKILAKDGKEGQAPYCALPQDQIRPGDSCNNPYGNDPKRLNRNNQNVVCTFRINWSATYVARPTLGIDVWNKLDQDFDRCFDNNEGGLDCTVVVKIWPTVRIPFLSEIWNNTLYSDTIEGQAGVGVGSPQETGRPGIFWYFMPQSVAEEYLPMTYQALQTKCSQGDQSACQRIQQEISQCLNSSPDSGTKAACIQNFFSNSLPGKTDNSDSAPKRFVGGVKDALDLTRDCTLKVKVLQEEQGINCDPDQ